MSDETRIQTAIETAGARRFGSVQCGEQIHIWKVEGEWDNPVPGALCKCGQQAWHPFAEEAAPLASTDPTPPDTQLVALMTALRELSLVPDMPGIPYFVFEPQFPGEAFDAVKAIVQRRAIPGSDVIGIFQAIEEHARTLAPFATDALRKAERCERAEAELSRLRAEHADLVKDRDRLDWLQANPNRITRTWNLESGVRGWRETGSDVYHEKIRPCIDAARGSVPSDREET